MDLNRRVESPLWSLKVGVLSLIAVACFLLPVVACAEVIEPGDPVRYIPCSQVVIPARTAEGHQIHFRTGPSTDETYFTMADGTMVVVSFPRVLRGNNGAYPANFLELTGVTKIDPLRLRETFYVESGLPNYTDCDSSVSVPTSVYAIRQGVIWVQTKDGEFVPLSQARTLPVNK